MNELLNYFNGDTMAADVWADKYQMKDQNSTPLENTPDDMHSRMAIEFGRVEIRNRETEIVNIKDNITALSKFGQELFNKRFHQSNMEIIEELFSYFEKFSQIVPQGSIMANLGNKFVFGSLSNCFGVAPPEDSYGGIMKTDEEIAQLMKRRGGVGAVLDNIRPTMAYVSNVSKTSTGVPSFSERYSNTTREVAQEGRRGAFMILLMVKHPDIFRFVTMKDDRTKVTGANVSVKFTDEFMKAVEEDRDFICTFPVNVAVTKGIELVAEHIPYNTLVPTDLAAKYIMKIRATELFTEFVNMAHGNAEPGAAYIDRIVDYSPDGVYEMYVPEVCNPCGEQWFHAYDTCRLIALNLYGMVKKAFEEGAEIDYDLLYEAAYMQQRIGDDLVDLEAEYIDRILAKLESDPEPYEVKRVEIELWQKIKKLALAGRRTGSGLTALGDMLAAVNTPYYSPEVVEKVMKTKMRAELDCTIDLAILRGPFEGWDADKEFEFHTPEKQYDLHIQSHQIGRNSFFQMLLDEFPEQAYRMYKYGRRNVSWSTVAPGGTISIMTQTSSGLEPLFKHVYFRKKKINANQTGVRVDYVDQSGDSWQEYPVFHPKFKEWIKKIIVGSVTVNGFPIIERELNDTLLEVVIEKLTREEVKELFELSPWYKSEADDISWENRLDINAIIQRYTSNSLSCTINLPKDVSKEVVHNIYFYAWKKGLKGVTIYRDGSRSGVLSTEQITNKDEFGYNEATPRPKELEADYHYVKVNGMGYAVIVGKLNGNPYEVFAFARPIFEGNLEGKLVEVEDGSFSFISNSYTIEKLELAHAEEKLLTRFASLLLRQGTHPKYVVKQVEKSELSIVSFGTAVARVLKNYIPDEDVQGETCPNCGEATLRREEGCKKCTSCGHSKC